MSDIVLVHNEKDLFIYFQKIRLETAKRLNELKIASSKNIKEEKPTIKGVAKNVSNFFKRGMGNYEKKSEIVDKEIASFYDKNSFVIDEDAAKELVFSLFSEDKCGLSKLVFAVTVILDDEYKYKYVNEGLEAVSDILYGNAHELTSIKKQLESNYNAISPNKLSTLQKGLLLGVAITALVGVIAMPVLLGARAGASAAATTTALAAHGFGDMQIGLGVITAESLLMGAAFTGIAYGGMKLYNDAMVKKEFLSLTPEKNALYLAIQCTYIERIKKTISEDEFKEQLDTILKDLSVLKSDLDYYLFVEKEATKDNKAKMDSFHKFDNRLIKSLGL